MAVTKIVAQDGSAQYKDVQTAIDAVPVGNKERVVIEVKPGVYRQPLYIPKTKNLVTLRGSSAEETVLTWDNTANKPIKHHQVLKFLLVMFVFFIYGKMTLILNDSQDQSVIGTGTFVCGTVIVEGSDFIADGITFENSAPGARFVY